GTIPEMLFQFAVSSREVVAVDGVEMNKSVTLGAQQVLPCCMRPDLSQGTRRLDDNYPGSTGRFAPALENLSLEAFDVDLQPVNFRLIDIGKNLIEGDRWNQRLVDVPSTVTNARRNFLRAGGHPGVRHLVELQHSRLISNGGMDD